MFTEPGSARQEAERLVAAALAFASLAANAHPEFATGSSACCVCPLCRLIEAVRDPDPHFVERLATGAGDLAVGVASLLRNLAPQNPDGEPADPWRAATTADAPARPGSAPEKAAPAGAPENAAPKAAARAPKAASTPKAAPLQGESGATVAKKTVAKKAVAKKAVTKKSGPDKPPADPPASTGNP